MNPALKPRWANLCKQARLDGSAEWRELSAAYGDPARAYHNMDHIADCLLRFDEHADLAIDPVALEFGIWFHDIVYDARAADNEERSAVAAEEFLAATAFGNVVGDLIRATKHHAPPGTPDAALLCDIDLSILGRSPGKYDAYWVFPGDDQSGRLITGRRAQGLLFPLLDSLVTDGITRCMTIRVSSITHSF